MSKIIDNTMDLTNKLNPEYVIKNEQLKENIKFMINKSNIELEDLLKIEEITLNSVTISGKQNNVYFEDIKLFPNLKKIEIKNNRITCENIKYLDNIDEIVFYNCIIDTIEGLNVKSISFIGCKINCDLEFKIKLFQLSIINTNCNSFEFLKNQNLLEKLVIKNVEKFTMDKIDFYMPINYLSIEDIPEFRYDILKNYSNLDTISIDWIGNNDTNEHVNKLKEMGYNVIYNDMYKV